MIECSRFLDVATILDPDAGNHAKLGGVFAAIHRPVPGEQSVAGLEATPVADASVDAYEAISGDPGHEWPMVIPVLGEPGTGKSHLVRSVWSHFSHKGGDDFAIVYVPRIRMNIAGVMERLLDVALHDSDPSVQAAAQGLLQAAKARYQDRDVDRVARELRAEVMFQLKSVAKRRSAAEEEGVIERQIEGAADALEVILKEGGDFEAYVHSADSAIGRRVAVLVEGRPDVSVFDAPAGFTVEELRSYGPRIAGQSRQFQDAVRRLVSKGDFGPLELAVSLLNEALDRAVSELIAKGTEGGGLTFTEVFRRLRESLYTAGRELVIFVEELKLLGGIERELLESFLDNRAAAGLDPICRVRALIACTTGEWKRLSQDIGTLTSRLDAWRAPRYSLDGPVAVGDVDPMVRLADMAAHYLNATRVGVDALEASFASSSTTDWAPPNACDDCSVRHQCHDAFGAVPSGSGEIGLFPFTLKALERAQENAQMQQIQMPLEDGLNPRVLLNGVLTPMLKHASTADGGAIPSVPLARELGFPPAAEATLRDALITSGLQDEDAAIGAVLLEVWGDTAPAAEDGRVEWSADSGVARMLGASPPPTVSVRPIVIARPEAPGKRLKRESFPGLQAELARWRNGGPLDSEPSRTLRNRINALLVRYLEWSDLVGVAPRVIDPRTDLMLREAGLADPEKLILFEDVGAVPTERGVAAMPFEFRRDDDDYTFLSAVANSAEEELQADELVALAEGLDHRAQLLRRHIEGRGVDRVTAVAIDHPVMNALFVSSLVLGLDPGLTTQEGAPMLLEGFVAETADRSSKSAVSETRELFELVTGGVRVPRDDELLRQTVERAGREQAREWILRRFGLRLAALPSERENVHMLDVAPIYDVILGFATRESLNAMAARKADHTRGESSALANYGTAVQAKLDEAMKREIARTRPMLAVVREVVDVEKEAPPQKVADAIERATEAAASADRLARAEGMVPSGEVAGSYRKYSELFDQVSEHVDAEHVIGVMTQIASTSATSRSAAAALFRDYGGVNSYREVAETVLDRTDVYLKHLASWIRAKNQATANPVIEGFDSQYQALLGDIRSLVQKLGADL